MISNCLFQSKGTTIKEAIGKLVSIYVGTEERCLKLSILIVK